MVSQSPKLRSDLAVSRQKTPDGAVFVIKDPTTDSFFRFPEVESFIAEQLDGETPLDVVRRRVETRFDGTLPAGTLDAFVEHLDKTGLLESGEAREKRRSRRWRPRGSFLYLRFPLLDPNELFARLGRVVRFCFTPTFLAASAMLMALALGVTVAHWGEVTGDLSQVNLLQALPPTIALLLIIVSTHEFAHGLTCRHFGGEVHELGFMLLYFQPAFYCNVSDAWLFPEKAKRLWVSLAGAWAELTLWALATLTWWLTQKDTLVNYLALIAMTISGVKSLLNFNPFIKLDGYYLLSDYLDIPNLRRKSFAYVGGSIKRIFGIGPETRPEVSRRERGIFLVYGTVATVFSFMLLTYVMVRAGGFFLDNRQHLAFLLLTGLVGLRSHVRFRRLFGTSGGLDDPDGDGDAFQATAEVGDMRHRTRSRRRKSTRFRKRRLFWVAVLVAIAAFLVVGRMQLRIGGAFTILPEENADVRAEVEGIVETIVVDEGDSVATGDVIARLSASTLQVEQEKIDAQIRETRANLQKMLAGPTDEEIAVARAGVSRADDALTYARSKVERFRNLFEVASVTRQELETAQEAAATAENELAEAKGRLNVLLRGTRPEEIEATRAQVDRLEAQRRYLAHQLGLLEIVSPVAGVVATPSRQLEAMEGQWVAKGALIAKVYDFDRVRAQLTVSEKEIADVRARQRVVLRARAYPDTEFHGSVTAIGTAAEGSLTPGTSTASTDNTSTSSGPASTAFTVTTMIDNRSHLLKPGMTGRAKVLAGERRIGSIIARRLARTFKVEFWSWW